MFAWTVVAEDWKPKSNVLRLFARLFGMTPRRTRNRPNDQSPWLILTLPMRVTTRGAGRAPGVTCFRRLTPRFAAANTS
jgi:hypothetical protein